VWHTILLSALAGLIGANAVPHFVKGMVGEQFPNVLGNGSLRNAVAGVASVFAGVLVMAVFHGLGGAYRLNSVLGLPNPPRT